MTDGEVLTKLRSARQITFFTRDAGFYRRSFCHPALRMAKVVRLQPSGIVYWVRNSNVESLEAWK
jgi:hypothetical protein